MATQPCPAKIFYPSEYQSIPMDADDDRPSAPSKSLAQIAENQCLTENEIYECYDTEREWDK
jgi:hypothetical protein